MKRLLILRHAKSSWAEDMLEDHDRPLNARGERDSFTMARYIADIDEALEVVFCSTAARALDFAQVISELADISLVPDLSFYTFDEDELMEILRSLPDHANRVAIVAHNPAVHQVANRLGDNQLEKFPTAGLAAFNCDIESWRDLAEANCELAYFETPKQLASGYGE